MSNLEDFLNWNKLDKFATSEGVTSKKQKRQEATPKPSKPNLSGDDKRRLILDKIAQASNKPSKVTSPSGLSGDAKRKFIMDKISSTKKKEKEEIMDDQPEEVPIIQNEIEILDTKSKAEAENILCIYHGRCDDGFASAYTVYKKFGKDNVEFCPGFYGNPPTSDIKNREVFIVDFSYSRSVTKSMLDTAKSITILDHHRTAAKNLKNLDQEYDNLTLIIDQTKAGCGVTWDYLFPETPMPDILEYIQDNDINKKEFKETQDVVFGLRSKPYDFKTWERLSIPNLIKEGQSIRRFLDLNIREELERNVIKKRIAGFAVDTINLSRFTSGGACTVLAKGKPFAASYYDSPKGKVYSLRSDQDGVDVSKIAEKFGGGGHFHAAGFLATKKNKHLIKRLKNP